MDQTQTASELADEITGNKASVLRSLHFFDGEGNTSEIRKAGDIPDGSTNYHLRTLEDVDLIEHVGWQSIGTGGEAKVWSLTARGERVTDHLTDDQPAIDDLDEVLDAVDEHDTRLSELQESHQSKTSEMEQEIEALRSEFMDVKQNVKELLDKLDGSTDQS